MQLARVLAYVVATATLSVACSSAPAEATGESEQAASVNGKADCFTECKSRIVPSRARCTELAASIKWFSLYRGAGEKVNEASAERLGWGTTAVTASPLHIGFNGHVDGCAKDKMDKRGWNNHRFFLPYCDAVMKRNGPEYSKWYKILKAMWDKYQAGLGQKPNPNPLPRGLPITSFEALIAASCWTPCKNQLFVECMVEFPDVMPNYRIVSGEDEVNPYPKSWTYKEMCLWKQLGGTWPAKGADIKSSITTKNVALITSDAGVSDGSTCTSETCTTCSDDPNNLQGPVASTLDPSELPPELQAMIDANPELRAELEKLLSGESDFSYDNEQYSTSDTAIAPTADLAPTVAPAPPAIDFALVATPEVKLLP